MIKDRLEKLEQAKEIILQLRTGDLVFNNGDRYGAFAVMPGDCGTVKRVKTVSNGKQLKTLAIIEGEYGEMKLTPADWIRLQFSTEPKGITPPSNADRRKWYQTAMAISSIFER